MHFSNAVAYRHANDDTDVQFIAEKIQESAALIQRARKEVGSFVWGQDDVIDNSFACMIAGGNLLAEGPPGTAKTRLIANIAGVMGLDFRRVQFTPDLMPSDILGSEVLEEDETGKKIFRFIKGPLFTQYLMADEINRAAPRTQSALLEAMEEKRVTVAGKTYDLKRPFQVMATQNPIEQHGTNPLPEAQLDRFMMKLDINFPDADAERRVWRETTGTNIDLRALFNRVENGEDLTETQDTDRQIKIQQVMTPSQLIAIQTLAKAIPISELGEKEIERLVRGLRPVEGSSKDVLNYVSYGPGTRAGQAFTAVAKAKALIQGKCAVDVDDIRSIAVAVLSHRMGLSYQARHDKVNVPYLIERLTR